MQDLEKIKQEAEGALNTAASLDKIEEIRISYLGKSGVISEKMKLLGSLPPEEKKTFGAAVNQIKTSITELLDRKKQELEELELNKKLANEVIDITLPVREQNKGSIHPISQVIEEATAIFAAMGFSVAEGPDVEDDYNNFSALNIPEEHPARQMHDTFYLPDKGAAKTVLRTHTSPVQIRTMKNNKPPIKIIAPGRTYRSDSDMTHSPMFHQIEALYIDKNVNMGQLKFTIAEFLKAFFGIDNLKLRFRASFFPFTEPSAEIDIGCKKGGGELKIGEGDDWLEIMGCGMVHPNVLKNCGIDPEIYSGFAFGMGVERIAMLKYGIPDLRTFFEADMRWLKHYNFSSIDIPNLVKGVA